MRCGCRWKCLHERTRLEVSPLDVIVHIAKLRQRSNASNMLFIDHPAQVGFSYSTAIPGYETKSSEIAQLPNATCFDFAGDTCGTYSYPNLTNTANSTADAAPSMWRTLQGCKSSIFS